jgi:hypothetical protein
MRERPTDRYRARRRHGLADGASGNADTLVKLQNDCDLLMFITEDDEASRTPLRWEGE